MIEVIEERTARFRRELAKKPRHELLEILQIQDPRLVEHVLKIEDVFATKLTHLTWPDGNPITSRKVTREELALLIDEPFEPSVKLSKMGVDIVTQKKLHIANDPVLFAKHYLGITPRAYQVFVLRNPSLNRILRFGRRSGKSISLVISMLHFCFVKKKAKVVVLAPAKVQVEELYKTVIDMLEEAPILQKSFVERSVQNPQIMIEFKNGSRIKFFTTGVASASRADSVRGQEADLVVLDEMDYMHPDDFKAILPLLQVTDEDATERKRLLGASTPSGKREQFYDWCVNPPEGFASFYFPSHIHPAWDEQAEQSARELTRHDPTAFTHEYEADFGDQAEGVYPRKFLDPCFLQPEVLPDEITGEYKEIYPSWEYKDMMTDHQSEYVIGVDWNKFSAGVMIAVLEVMSKNHENPYLRGKVRLCHREEFTLDDYTLIGSVDRIIALNRAFNPRWIYVDRGFGEAQVELLKKHGVDHPTTGLHRKVVAVNSSVKAEIRNPVTGEREHRPYKALMVNSLRDMMEQNQILFPHHDDALYAELGAYVVIRETPNGEPVFGASGKQSDHVHDSVALATLAITEKMSQFAKKRNYTGPISVDVNGFGLGGRRPIQKLQEEESEDIEEAPEQVAPRSKTVQSANMYRRRPMSNRSPRAKGSIQRKMF